MKSAVVVLAICVIGNVSAWGALFNRFSPEMLANMGYGGHGGGGGYSRSEGDDGILEEYVSENNDDEPCYGKRCTANEHCCPGSVCVDVDGVIGQCLFAYGRRVGELCRRDSDCESGLVCAAPPGQAVLGAVRDVGRVRRLKGAVLPAAEAPPAGAEEGLLIFQGSNGVYRSSSLRSNQELHSTHSW
ncbi:unnamed protein product [Phaedon cochleariae]|uniref:ITG-like peptide n=1 Tax=Phaedon cochleariae TaxID=80249 RepID=A0A9N9SIG8_PHACE|nr:unnamed protein product [Phaedon cochleariae]